MELVEQNSSQTDGDTKQFSDQCGRSHSMFERENEGE